MGTKVNSNYEDLITFTRASGGHALRPVSYGDELVINGDFSTDSDWTLNNSAVISGGSVSFTTANDAVKQNLTGTQGKIVLVSFDAVRASGTSLRVYVGGELLNDINSPTGSYEYVLVGGTTTDEFQIRSSGFVGTIDNVSVKEVLFDQPDGTLTLFEHPDNVPRVEYDADGNRLGLLVEEARTNLVTYSEEFSNAYWPKADVTVSASSEIDPSGGTNAYELIESATTANHLLNKAGVAGANTYSEFIFAKANTRYWIRLQSQSPSNSWVNVNLLTGEKGLSGGGEDSSSIENVGNGWYKISLNFTATTTTGPQIFVLDSDRSGSSPSYLGDGSSSILIYGAQLEAGSFPTSYIKSNSGSTTTRSADVASIPVADFGYNQSEGTVVAQYTPTKVDGDVRGVFEIAANTSSNRAYHSASEGNHWLVRSEGATPAAIDIGTVPESTNKVAAVYKKDDFAISVNGASVSTDTSGNVPISIIEINIGALQNGFHLNGYIKSIQYYPRRLTNAQLQDLTS